MTDPSPGPGAKSYRLVRFLREGGFGSVFQAQVLPDSAEYVAVKAIQKDKLCDEKLKTVKNEIRIQSRLEHDNVAKLLGCFESELHVFLILEYFSGGDLEQRLHEHGPFSEPEARGMLRQLLSGISYLHKHHILHRDLKLANVLLDKERVALCDFGLAVNVQSSDNTRRTLCGTPNSISPEVISQVK